MSIETQTTYYGRNHAGKPVAKNGPEYVPEYMDESTAYLGNVAVTGPQEEEASQPEA